MRSGHRPAVLIRIDSNPVGAFRPCSAVEGAAIIWFATGESGEQMEMWSSKWSGQPLRQMHRQTLRALSAVQALPKCQTAVPTVGHASQTTQLALCMMLAVCKSAGIVDGPWLTNRRPAKSIGNPANSSHSVSARALLARQFLFYGVYLHIHGEVGFIHGTERFEYRLRIEFGRRSSSRAILCSLTARPKGTSECGVAL